MTDLSAHILDLAQNGLKAGATKINILIEKTAISLAITIEDNGKGMDQTELLKVQDPFYTSRTTRRVGLGIPLFKQTCEATGGHITLTSKIGMGTTLHGLMFTNHIDAIPLGDIAEAIYFLLINPANATIYFEYIYHNNQFVLNQEQVKQVLGDVPLTNGDVMVWLKEYIREGIEHDTGGNA